MACICRLKRDARCGKIKLVNKKCFIRVLNIFLLFIAAVCFLAGCSKKDEPVEKLDYGWISESGTAANVSQQAEVITDPSSIVTRKTQTNASEKSEKTGASSITGLISRNGKPLFKGWIKAPSGQRINRQADFTSDRIDFYADQREVGIYEIGPLDEKDGKTGYWLRVLRDSDEGWVFGGYVSVIPPKPEPEKDLELTMENLAGMWFVNGWGQYPNHSSYYLLLGSGGFFQYGKYETDLLDDGVYEIEGDRIIFRTRGGTGYPDADDFYSELEEEEVSTSKVLRLTTSRLVFEETEYRREISLDPKSTFLDWMGYINVYGNQRLTHDTTMLMYAVKYGMEDVFLFLMNSGVNLNDKDMFGRTVLDCYTEWYSKWNRTSGIEKYLTDYFGPLPSETVQSTEPEHAPEPEHTSASLSFGKSVQFADERDVPSEPVLCCCWPKSGEEVLIRQQPSFNAAQVGFVAGQTGVRNVYEIGALDEKDGQKGYWLRVQSGAGGGWVFGGDVSVIPATGEPEMELARTKENLLGTWGTAGNYYRITDIDIGKAFYDNDKWYSGILESSMGSGGWYKIDGNTIILSDAFLYDDQYSVEHPDPTNDIWRVYSLTRSKMVYEVNKASATTLYRIPAEFKELSSKPLVDWLQYINRFGNEELFTGSTLFMYAIKCRKYDVARFLINSGIDVHHQNEAGETAADYLADDADEDIKRVLESE